MTNSFEFAMILHVTYALVLFTSLSAFSWNKKRFMRMNFYCLMFFLESVSSSLQVPKKETRERNRRTSIKKNPQRTQLLDEFIKLIMTLWLKCCISWCRDPLLLSEDYNSTTSVSIARPHEPLIGLDRNGTIAKRIHWHQETCRETLFDT